MDRRLIALGCAGLVILGLVIFRERQLEQWRSLPPGERPVPRRHAPTFQLFDHHQPSQFVKFERYLGRTKLALLFFDGELGLQRDPLFQAALQHAEAIEGHGVQLVAVSLATPVANRNAMQELSLSHLPFPVLTDIDMHGPVNVPAHRAYGLLDERTGKLRTGLFLIDRKQTVAMDTSTGLPRLVDEPIQVLEQLAAGTWPVNQ